MSEEERAARLAEELDRLLAEEPVDSRERLLQVARGVLKFPATPRTQAVTRFEAQLDHWFDRSAPPKPLPKRLTASRLVLGVIIVVILFILISLGVQAIQTPARTSTAQMTLSPSASPITQTPVLSSTISPIPFTRIVIDGQINSIQNNSLIILGQSIQIDGDVKGLCLGDVVHLQVSIGSDGTYHVQRSAIVVESSGCAPIDHQGDGGDD